MEFAAVVLDKVLDYTLAPIGRQLGYLIQYNSNINSLRTQVESLTDRRHGVQGLVDAAERNGEVIKKEVQTWLTKVNTTADGSDKFLTTEVNSNQRCSFPSCPNLISRYRASRKAKKTKLAVDELLCGGKFDGVSFPAPPPAIFPMYNRDEEVFEVFKSRKSTFTDIMEALNDDKISILGVYGMGGIGKTTLVKDVAEQAGRLKNLFDEIVFAVVSQTQNIIKIQGEIAEMLGLKLEDNNVLTRARRLRDRIKMKRVLVILDDLWSRLDLNKIGLPLAGVGKGCKILLTTRDQHVCVTMESQMNFPLDCLSRKEAWTLFRKIAGDTVDSSDLQPIATQVANECAGLPLSIVTVAGSLKDIKKLSVWNEALRRLKNPVASNIKGMNAEVYSSLRLSYDFLDAKEVKYCFLLCTLTEEDSNIDIDDLVRYGMGLGLFDRTCTFLEVRDTVDR